MEIQNRNEVFELQDQNLWLVKEENQMANEAGKLSRIKIPRKAGPVQVIEKINENFDDFIDIRYVGEDIILASIEENKDEESTLYLVGFYNKLNWIVRHGFVDRNEAIKALEEEKEKDKYHNWNIKIVKLPTNFYFCDWENLET